MRFGVPPGGAADPWAHDAALILAGAPRSAQTVEITLGGAEVMVTDTCAVALAGADLGAERDDGAALEAGRVHRLPAGARLRFTGSPSPRAARTLRGVRAYLCLAGGVAVDADGGLAPRRPGDLSGVGHAWPDGTAPHPALARDPVRFVPGPDLASLAPGAVEAFAARAWTVSQDSSRMGVRLDGEPLEAGAEILSHPLVPGAIQIPASGRPIAMLADSPTLGGYPVAGVVARADLPVIAQRRPGEVVRFQPTTADAARTAWAHQQAALDRVATTLAGDAVWHRLAGDIRG
ncbi:MAG: allophanate hydrolase subunit 2 family protein [Chloroflexota bacterium]